MTLTTADYFYMIWCYIALLLGLSGNTYVLHSTIKHKAIKLDTMSVWLIQNISVTDILHLLFLLLPILLSLHSGKVWILGQVACEVVSQYRYCAVLSNMILINLLSLNKVLRCYFPLRNLYSTRKQRIAVTMATVVLCATQPLWRWGWGRSGDLAVSFSEYLCYCWDHETDTTSYLFNRLDLYCAILLQIGPCSALFIMNAALVYIALKRSHTTVNWANVSIVVFVTGVFIASILPHFVYFIKNRQNWTDSVDLRWTVATTLVSTFSNPVIYFLTNPGFRSFTIGWVTRSTSRFKSQNVRSVQVASLDTKSGGSLKNDSVTRASTKESVIVHHSKM
ncbi:hypothetical protein ACHWQZ_G008443 [Mnemiopsis leidyi]